MNIPVEWSAFKDFIYDVHKYICRQKKSEESLAPRREQAIE